MHLFPWNWGFPASNHCKTLIASTHGGFSIPRHAAEKLFPSLIVSFSVLILSYLSKLSDILFLLYFSLVVAGFLTVATSSRAGAFSSKHAITSKMKKSVFTVYLKEAVSIYSVWQPRQIPIQTKPISMHSHHNELSFDLW